MSVLINGMKMPKEGCRDCLLVKRGQVFDICPFLKRAVNGNVERGGKPYGCPLIELPDHGDLIDRDALMASYAEEVKPSNNSDFMRPPRWNDAVQLTELAPVVIPAERSEE